MYITTLREKSIEGNKDIVEFKKRKDVALETKEICHPYFIDFNIFMLSVIQWKYINVQVINPKLWLISSMNMMEVEKYEKLKKLNTLLEIFCFNFTI